MSAFHADARKPSLLGLSAPGARQEAPQSSALRLCRPLLRYAPSTPLIAPFQVWRTPPLALAVPAGEGQKWRTGSLAGEYLQDVRTTAAFPRDEFLSPLIRM